MEEKITGAETLMLALRDEGVTTIFGYPGGAIMPVYDSLYDYTRGERRCFRHILVRHEQAAAHAAEGYARVSGKVGVCVVTSGPGATNTLTGIADAMMDSTPIVLIAGQVATSSLGTDAFQEVDLVGVAAPISKWAYQIRSADNIARAVSRAFYIARSGRPGPVVLDFTRNAQTSLTTYKHEKVRFVRSYVPYPELREDAVVKAASLINGARRPMALVGQGVELGGAQQELLDFLERGDIPAGRTLLGLSALPSNHYLNMGMLGMHGSLATNVKQQQCDVLIAIGMRFSDRVTGRLDTYARQAKIIHLDIDPSEINKNVKTDVAVIADCKASLPAITRLMKKGDHRKWIDSFKPLSEKERIEVIEPAIHPGEGPLLMGEVAYLIGQKTRGEAVLVNDVGQNQMMSSRYFHYHQRRSIVTSGGLGTMGFCLPAAIGAAIGAPKRTIIAIMGDGGMQMTIEELGTIMEQRVPIKIVVFNNNYLGNVRQWQDLYYPGRRSFTYMLNPDYSKIAEAYGIPYRLTRDREDLDSAVAALLEAQGPFILECVIKEDADVLPMVLPGTSIDEMRLKL